MPRVKTIKKDDNAVNGLLSPLKVDKVKPGRRKSFSREKALIDISRGLTYEEIGAKNGVSKQAVNSAIKPIIDKLHSIDEVKDFKGKQDHILTSCQMKLLTAALDDEAVKKSSTLQLITSYGVLFDKQRLVNNLSTQNLAVKDIVSHLNDQEIALRKELDTLQVVSEQHNCESGT